MLVEMQVCPSFPIPLAPPGCAKVHVAQSVGLGRRTRPIFPSSQCSTASMRSCTMPRVRLQREEERDLYFGQLFGLKCFVRARILFLEEQGPDSATSQVVLVLAHLTLSMGPHKKPCGVSILKRFSGFVGQPPRESMCHWWRIEALARRDFF
ncbi:DNA polymerase phi [Colletotrichum paranaense]|uniref:DNA polymerase phi n=1 Tax=Colletotrichum paranaense TaxID=1914294 RepID=A0ABQ9SS55_9PEZI|nr:DNA polymerase phi [Colletotrichum paranaense]KAK1542341.1 DNA polymerase phi [Colletotrichum paranaense]